MFTAQMAGTWGDQCDGKVHKNRAELSCLLPENWDLSELKPLSAHTREPEKLKKGSSVPCSFLCSRWSYSGFTDKPF